MCLASGILQKGGKLPCPVDASGMFTGDVPDFKGQHVKVTVLANKPVNSSLSAAVSGLNAMVLAMSYALKFALSLFV